MKFLIYGAGVIGSIFAGKLTEAGYEVTVLARGKRYDELTENGLILRKSGTAKREITYPAIINTLEENDIYDYVMVVMQKTQVADVLPVLKVNRSKNIVFVVNNPLGYSEWMKAVGKNRVMIGFPAAGGDRTNGIVNYFIMSGVLSLFQTTTFGELSGRKSKRLAKLIYIMRTAGIPSTTSPNMDAWQKTHVAFVTALANLLYQYDSDNYEASKHYKDLCTCANAIKEGFSVIEELGYRITPGKMKIYSLPAPLLSFFMKLIFNTKFSETVMAKHTIAARGEMKCLQREFDTLIRLSRLEAPNIERLSRYLYLY